MTEIRRLFSIASFILYGYINALIYIVYVWPIYILNSLAQQPLWAKAYGAHTRSRDRGPWGAKHMSRLGGQSNAGPPVFSSQACLVLNFIDPL
jgi:hypothetical protein